MNYFDDAKNVEHYLAMSDGYDGQNLIDELTQQLTQGSTLLELGMGPGKDLDILSQHYQVTGSDYSEHFLNAYRTRKPQANLLQLDASKPDLKKPFDAIYSNKVLHQFTTEELKQSFEYQAKSLNKGGLVMHSFWRGTGREVFGGDTHYYYQLADIEAIIAPWFSLTASASYEEFSAEDSFWIIAHKR